MRKSLLWSLLAIGVLGCGSSQTKSQPTATPQPAAQHAGGGECPMKKMAGAKIVATDTSDGVAVEFTTTGDVDALRAHVHEMAAMHNQMAGTNPGDDMHGGMGSGEMEGGMGGGDMHGGMQMVPSRATVEDITGGARMVLVPNDPSQLAALRTQVREHVARMSKGECPMMGAPQQPQPTDDEHAQHHPPGA